VSSWGRSSHILAGEEATVRSGRTGLGRETFPYRQKEGGPSGGRQWGLWMLTLRPPADSMEIGGSNYRGQTIIVRMTCVQGDGRRGVCGVW
jgi:hypothetical protein